MRDRDSYGTTIEINGEMVDVTVDQRAIGDRAIMQITRDDTGVSVYDLLDSAALESVQRMGIEGMGRALSELESALRHHDWNYQYSDVMSSWKRGQEEHARILRLCAELPDQIVREAWAKYGQGPYPFEDKKSA